MILRVSGCHNHGYYNLGLPNVTNKSIGNPINFQFQISSNLFLDTTSVSLYNIWDILLLKSYLLII